ncbi:MAG TPA: CopD family protein [Cytophagales bacterium]|nr:CopD family protein [Cytophagales bacterium]
MWSHYFSIKALHIIFIVTWFAGLFYIYRLFIYHREAQDRSEAERTILSAQFKIMQSRLWYGITWPSAILTLILGLTLAFSGNWFSQGFFQVKLAFVTALYAYHVWTQIIFKQFQRGVFKYSSTQLRIINEIATIFLVAISFIIELQNSISWLYGVLGVLGIALVMMVAIKVYKKIREK